MESFVDELEAGDLAQFKEEGLTDNPEDYYFAIDPDINGDIGDLAVIITPRKLYDTEERWSDCSYIGALLEDSLHGYYDVTEATFSPEDETLSEDQIREDLIGRGFVEHVAILGERDTDFSEDYYSEDFDDDSDEE